MLLGCHHQQNMTVHGILTQSTGYIVGISRRFKAVLLDPALLAEPGLRLVDVTSITLHAAWLFQPLTSH
jgi:hypothetical protein